MKDKHVHKDATPSEIKNKIADARDSSGFMLTDDEIERALQRLQFAVHSESVPEVWTVSEDDNSLTPVLGGGRSADHGIGFGASHEAESSVGCGAGLQADGANDLGTNHRAVQLTNPGTDRRRRNRGAVVHKRWGRIVSGTVAAAVLVGLFVSPLGSRAMAAAMQTLYFQNLTGVGQDDMTQIENALASGTDGGASRIDLKKYGTVDVSVGEGMEQNLTVSEASKLAGFSMKILPGFDVKNDNVNYTASRDITFRLNVDAINDLIHRLGGTTGFPESVNGQPIVFHIPAQMNEDVQDKSRSMSFTELKMPTVQVPSGVNLDDVRKALLELPFLPSDIRQSLSTSQNWANTLYVPTNGKVTNLTIDGYSAVLESQANGQYRSMIWLENGILYQLNGTAQTFPTDDSLVTQAKELAQ